MSKLIQNISSRVHSIPEALSVYINQLVYELRARRKDIIALSLGESFFEIPRFDFGELDFDRGYHYSETRGIRVLRERIAEYYRVRYTALISSDDIIISAGSKALIFMCMQALLENNDEVLIHEPAWLSYREQAKLVGASVKFIPWNTPCENFNNFFSNKTKLLIINNPNNPSGRVYSEGELLGIQKQCLNNGIFLLVDEAYSDFILDNSFSSMAKLVPNYENTIIVNSLSKNMGMSGWRLGYVISNEEILKALLKLNSHIITCAPTILQLYIAHHFNSILKYTLPQVKAVVEKRRRIQKLIDHIGLTSLSGGSTFYFFIDVGLYPGPVHDLALFLLIEKGISVVPGSAYGSSVSKFIRISIGTESEERIKNALLTIYDVITGGLIDSSWVRSEMKSLGLDEYLGGMSEG